MPKRRVGAPLTAKQKAQRTIAARASALKRKKTGNTGKLPKGYGVRAAAVRDSSTGMTITAQRTTGPGGHGDVIATTKSRTLAHRNARTAYAAKNNKPHPLGGGQALDGATQARVSSVGTVKDPHRQVKTNKRYKPLAQAAFAADKHPAAAVKAPITSSYKGASSPVKSTRAAGKRARKKIHGSDTRGR